MSEPAAVQAGVHVEAVSLGVRRSRQTKYLVRNATFTAAPASTTAIIGRSGAGKSTLLACLAGDVPPVSGRVRLAGVDVWPRPLRRRMLRNPARVGLMFQSGNLVTSLSVLQNVALPDRLRRERDWVSRAHHALDLVGLADTGSRRPASLSGGEQQRVAIARLIATRPEVALVDEPTSSLDEVTAETVSDALVQLAATGTSVIVVTHDLRLAARAGQTLSITNAVVHQHSGADVAMLRQVLEHERC
ncbi:putative ABC transport system ATP-binding protein [Curtobacterium sp. PhB130]|uniref:ATP-binding cassette domain-containing protein n=1 Tax=Curtobacterium sp. PhB130 TaxID=2485178 RepID=UPI000F95F4DD|nr:ATP-binding cassette domain-containing protein [Curtobacterium sp. PhB130]ROS77443.1 putative ABC transport system ATP-binding protein [Curtobacterium sp. PhB130]